MKLKLMAMLIITIIILSILNFCIILAYTDNKKAEVLISYRDDQDLYMITSIGCSIERIFKFFNIALVICPNNSIEKLRSYKFDIVPNFNVSLGITAEGFKIINIDKLSQNTSTTSHYWSWSVSRVSADIVWRYLEEEGSDTIIAILDTGIDPNHPLLSGKLIGWAEFDIKGRPICSSPHDTHGHGTYVSSIAVGGDGSNFVFGIAPRAKLMMALVLPYGYGSIAQVLAGLEWVLEPYDLCKGTKIGVKPNVVSMSFGAIGNYSNIFLPAIARLIENGIIPVAAIGNNGPYSSSNPGNIWGVIGVGATDFNNNIALFSSYEEVEWPEPPSNWLFKGYYPKRYRKPDVVAPGVNIPGGFPGGLFVIASGTSASTPIVASVSAIVSAKLMKQGFSGASLVNKVYDIITSTTMTIDHSGAGNGMIDAYLAIAMAKKISIDIVDIDINPKRARPLDKIAIDTISIGIRKPIDIYVAGVKVFSGITSSRYIIFEVPLTHIGKNPIVVIGADRSLYGRAFIEIVPRLDTNDTCFWGEYCGLFVSGLGIGDTIGIYLGDNLITLGFTDLRGSYIGLLITPFAREDLYYLTVIDFTDPTIILRSLVTINSSKYVETKVIQTIISKIYSTPILASTKQYYVAGTTDFIDLYVGNGSIKDVSIIYIYPAKTSIKIHNITYIDRGMYRIWIWIDREIYQEGLVIINILVTINTEKIPYLLALRIIPKDPYITLINKIEDMSREIYSNMTSLYRLANIIESLDTAVNSLSKSVNSLSVDLNKLALDIGNIFGKIHDISNRINIMNSTYINSIQRYDKAIEHIENDIVQTRILVLITLAISIITIIAITIIYKIKL